MKYAKKVFTFQPAATKIRFSQEDVRINENESKARARTRKILKAISTFIFGSSLDMYKKPIMTSADIFFIIWHIHLNIRFLVLYIDLSLEWGGFLVWMAFSLFNILMCPALASLYIFLGDYSDRSFITLWQMNPFFQGLSVGMVMFEAFKLIEAALILTSGLMSLPIVFYDINNDERNSDVIECTEKNDIFVFRPAWGVQYGISEEFTAIGYDIYSNKYENWQYDQVRVRYVGLILFIVLFIRILKYKRFRLFPIRIMPLIEIVMLFLAMLMVIFINKKPAESVVQTTMESYMSINAYLQIFAFTVSEYLPSHWVTIGLLTPTEAMNKKIWGICCIKIAFSFFMLFGIPYFLQDFREYVQVTDDRCLYTFGIHFIFVIMPLSLSRLVGKHFKWIVHCIYLFTIILNGICYILINLEMMLIAISVRSSLIYRFRNLLFILATIILYGFAMLLCVNTVHQVLFFLNFKAHFLTIFTYIILTVLGMASYGLDRINADHHFHFGQVFSHLKSSKFLFIAMSMLTILHIADLSSYSYRNEDNESIYWIIYSIYITPIFIGVLYTIGHRKAYHGLFHPLITWGRPDEILRTARRRKNLRQLFIYRTKKQCDHSCLLYHPTLQEEVDKEIENRRLLYNERLDFHNLLVN